MVEPGLIVTWACLNDKARVKAFLLQVGQSVRLEVINETELVFALRSDVDSRALSVFCFEPGQGPLNVRLLPGSEEHLRGFARQEYADFKEFGTHGLRLSFHRSER